MRELSVQAYTASIASFHQSIIHKSFSSQTLGKQGWVAKAGAVLVVGKRQEWGGRRETEGQSSKYEAD